MDDLDENLICEYLNYLKIESVNDLVKYNYYWKQIFSKIKYKYDKKIINSEKYNSELIYLNKVKKTIKDNYSLFDSYLKNINYGENKDPVTPSRINQDIIDNPRNSRDNVDSNTQYSTNSNKLTYNYSEDSFKNNGRNPSDENKNNIKKTSKFNTPSWTGFGYVSYLLFKNWPKLESEWRLFIVICLFVWFLSLLDLD